MKVRILFFGVLAEKAGTDSINIENAGDLKSVERLVLEKHPDFREYSYRISVNRLIATENEKLKDGDELAFMPPFAGG